MNTALVIGVAVLLVLCAGWLRAERGRWMLPSTRQFLRHSGWLRLFHLRVLHGYLYLRWQHLYAWIALHIVEPLAWNRLRRWYAARYHAKVLSHDQARRIVRVDRPIPLQDLERVIPYRTARHIVLTARPRLVAFECACRHARRHPCQPTQVCLFVGDPGASFMLEHHPRDARELTRQEALELLDAEHDRGHVHTAWFKAAMADRFYVICNCCPCCCAGIQVMKSSGAPFLASSGYEVEFDPELCANCGRCVEWCPFEAIHAAPDRPRIDAAACMGCGVCVDHCPAGALTLRRAPGRGTPLEVERLG